MRIPTATYRIQFNPDFGFKAAQNIVEYLKALGVSDLYASPVFKARAGSTHGYDVVDPTQLNPELGGKAAFEPLMDTLHHHEMGWLQDIVPNHMAYDGQNRYLMDVLMYGPDSEYFNYFDIEWDRLEEHQGKVLAPMLGDFYDRCLERGEIQLSYDESGLSVNYYSLQFPVRIETYGRFLSYHLERLAQQLGEQDRTYIKISGILYLVKNAIADLTGQAYREQVQFAKDLLWDVYQESEDVREFFNQNLASFNGTAEEPESFNLLDDLLSEQFYRLAFWKVGAEELNYRRFFTVNELICVRVDDEEVFDQSHDLICRLIHEGRFNGVRIDHIDGLYDPTTYLCRLRDRLGDVYIVVEKILELEERLPEDWPIQGTSGYESLNHINGVFCQQASQEEFTRLYRQLTDQTQAYEDLVTEKKRLIAETNLVGDIDNLAHFLKRVCQQYRYGRDLTLYGLRTAIEEVLIAFPIYCTYVNQGKTSKRDVEYIRSAIESARRRIPQLVNELNLLEKFLLLEYEDSLTEGERSQWLRFVMRLQQFTGPIMAKGVEDTLFYGYNRFISLNEVGGSPGQFGISLRRFHNFNQHRQGQWPHAMNATSTHDTKRSEDVRARLNVLSELPSEWEAAVGIWRSLNSGYKKVLRDRVVPDANDEYFLYQTLVGAFPFSEEELPSFTDRIADYVVKAVREAKVHTAWLRPDTDYEDSFVAFARAILTPGDKNLFLEKFREFQNRIADYGIYNSLSQVLLKLALPGVPDIYQGQELWDFSLVDPDNRRPVDYDLRGYWLHEMCQQAESDRDGLLKNLLDYRSDGRIKLWVTHRCLAARQTYADLFQQGDYQPLMARGDAEDHIIAFARQNGRQWLVAIAPRFLTNLIQPGEHPIGSIWDELTLDFPNKHDVSWYDWIGGQSFDSPEAIEVSKLLAKFPMALLIGEEKPETEKEPL
ncbi:malto-oligosyltrehalose synthase [Oscillatoria sp. CS-180]|uniref:malto-oligosyltrehalose synthase n=1 Tax=Oscillatoria sp. CS-180 TaxID=3021720 RepID=UPI00232DC454|nr:malto-oligosyltrehalose synthase [Oscillatoria sp. CS-180]MDB9527827.1 malto-oligosyltrehalose synthase [Oscillatoria sp. CS-180]